MQSSEEQPWAATWRTERRQVWPILVIDVDLAACRTASGNLCMSLDKVFCRPVESYDMAPLN